MAGKKKTGIDRRQPPRGDFVAAALSATAGCTLEDCKTGKGATCSATGLWAVWPVALPAAA